MNVEINLTGPGRGTVHIDGVELHNITWLQVDCEPGKANRVTVGLMANNLKVTGVAELSVVHHPVKPTFFQRLRGRR